MEKKVKRVVQVVQLVSLVLIMPLAHAGYINNNDGTVSDTGTTLMWQKCTAPATGIGCSSPAPALYSWDDALGYCNSLSLGGYVDWRLPNVKELQSLVDVAKLTAPNINTTYFPDTRVDDDYWTSTTSIDSTVHAWYVHFDLVGVKFVMTSGVDKRTPLYVRCVR